MERYQRGELTRKNYLERMGAITLKASHAMGKTVVEVDPSSPSEGPETSLNDTMSETRALPNPDYESQDSDVEQEDPFLDRLKKSNRRAFIEPIVKVYLSFISC